MEKKTPKITKQDREKAKEKGINMSTFENRVYMLKWTVEEALEKEIRGKECYHNNVYESNHRKIKICVNCKKIIE